jgi:hypothetical protein
LSLRGVQYLHGDAERRPGDGRCGRDGPACGLKAEEPIDSDYQEGAALMAKLLAKAHHEDVAAVRLFQGAEALFRSQELGYRAMPLF